VGVAGAIGAGADAGSAGQTGTEIRHISLLENDGVTKVIVPVYRDSMMGVMTLRSEADLAALKTAAK
jgi:hypothetical protein